MPEHFLNRRLALTAVAGALVVSALPVSAQTPASVKLNTTYGLGIRGFDPVAYFTVNKAVKGLPNITTVHEGTIYEFSNEEHKKLFIANPTKYLPEYGGFCAYATAHGYKADVDPYAFAINNDKLYLNFAVQFRDDFQKNPEANISTANANWSAKVRDMTEIAR